MTTAKWSKGDSTIPKLKQTQKKSEVGTMASRSILAKRIFLGSLAILAVVVMGAVIARGHLIEIEEHEKQHERIIASIDELTPSIARAIWQINRESLQFFLDTLASNPYISTVVYQDDFMQISSGQIMDIKNSAAKCDDLITRDFTGYVVKENTISSGELMLCFNYLPVSFSLQEFLKPSTLPFYLAIISTSLIFVIFSWNLVIAPLRNLTLIIANHEPIESFHRKPFFGFKGKDEIDVLVDELTIRTQALRDERALVEASFPEIEDAIVQTDEKHRVIRYNGAFEEIHSDIKELDGFDLTELYPEEVLSDVNGRKEIAEDKGKYFEIATTEIEGSHDNKTYIHVIRDLTEVKQLQNDAIQSSKLTALGTMSSGIAHDYNNLLASILSNAEFLQQNSKLKGAAKGALNSIVDASLRGSSLSNQLLEFAQNRQPKKQYLASDDIVNATQDMAKNVLGDGIEFTVKTRGQHYVYADEGAVTNALLNLIINARDALNGKGEIKLSTRAITKDAVDYEAFMVEDDGSGIPADLLDKVQDPFFTTKAKGHGSGLGLAMVASFADQTNGFVKIDSEPDKGTKVTVALPIMKKPELSKESSIKPIEKNANNSRILLIEDEISLCQVLGIFLQTAGYDVSTAFKYDDVVAKDYADQYFDLIISDVILGEKTVADVYEYFQLHGNDSPFFVITGNISDDMKSEVEEIHPVAIMEKPFKSSDFLQRVEECIKNMRDIQIGKSA